MPRIQPKQLSEIPELAPILQAGEQLMGFVANDGLTMAYRPDILKAFLALVQSIYADGEVENELKRLIGLICSTAAGCEYCQAHAANSAEKYGVNFDKIQAVWEFRTSDLFTARERVALEVAYKAGMTPNEASDEDFEALKAHFSDQAIIEIVSVISMYGFLNRWNSTLKTQLEAKSSEIWEKINN